MMNATDSRIYKRKQIAICLIYCISLMYFVFKAFFYYSELDNAPDAVAHLSYIYYEYCHPYEIFPEFDQMHMLELDYIGDKAYILRETEDICYLGHPPIYYKALAFMRCIKQDDVGVYFNLLRLCIINVSMVCLGLILCMEYGRQKLKETGDHLVSHLLFTAIMTNVPLLPYLAGYPTNDNLLYLELGIVLWGLERGVRGKRDYITYWMIALGLCMTVGTKLTLGLILTLAALFVAISVMVKERNRKLLACRQFYSTLLPYSIACVYFLYQKIVYHTIQPGLATLSPETYSHSIWAVSSDATRTAGESIQHFWTNFWNTWTNVYSHFITHDKAGTLANVCYGIFVFLFLSFTLYQLCRLLRGREMREQLVPLAVNVGAIVAMLYQFLPKISAYMQGGNGGYSARYYLCCIGIFALSAVIPLDMELSNKRLGRRKGIVLQAIMLLMVMGWVYYDFIYFLTSFSMFREFI